VTKADSNRRKHGAAFEAAMDAFLDPLAAIYRDPGFDGVEERWLAVGMLEDQALGLVVHTYEEDENHDHSHVRIISARRATRRERLEYETGIYLIREPAMISEYSPIQFNDDDDDDDGMLSEYDLKDGVRGKYYRANMRIVSFPIYLETDILMHYRAIAQSRGIETRELLNEILRSRMQSVDKPESRV
jgi:uncharacterized protein